jgi:hypothetical protein
MNVVAWLMLGNLILMSLTLWNLKEAKTLLMDLEDSSNKLFGRLHNIIEDLMEMNGRKKHDK